MLARSAPRFSHRTLLLLLAAAGVLLALAAMSLLMARLWPLGADYFYFFYPMAEQWVDGQFTMYDGAGERLFYPPWSLFVIIPLGFFPLELGKGVLFTASLVGLIAAVRIYQGSRSVTMLGVVFALANLHTFDLLVRGQIDVVVLLGLVLGAWAIPNRRPVMTGLALCLMVMKPPLNIALPGLLYLLAIRTWPRRELGRVMWFPVGVLIVSSLMVGLDWPLLFVRNVETPVNYLSISLWRGAAVLGLPAWPIAIAAVVAVIAWLRLAMREGLTDRTLSLALATNFVFTNYANGDHYILLIPALLYVARHSPRLALLAYLTTWTPLLRLPLGPDASPIDILYPVVLLGAAWYLRPATAAPQAAPASTPVRDLNATTTD